MKLRFYETVAEWEGSCEMVVMDGLVVGVGVRSL